MMSMEHVDGQVAHTGQENEDGVSLQQSEQQPTAEQDVQTAPVALETHLELASVPLGAAEAASTAFTDADTASLDELRQKVFDARGSRSELPPGFSDEARLPNHDAGPLGLTNNADSDSDSDSGSDLSSSSSSSSSSSDDDDDAVMATHPLSRVAGSDAGDDDEDDDDGGAAGGSRGPMSKNELQHADAGKLLGDLPFQEVPTELIATISPLGKVHGAVDDVLVIAQFEEKQNAQRNERSGPVLDSGSLLCTPQGRVIGFVFETFGSLLAPLYSVLLPSAAATKEYATDSDVYFLPSHSTLLRPAELRARQGKASDASNVYDEEPNEWEVDAMEFSDDEEEQEWKRRMKDKKRANKRGLEVAGGDTEGVSSGIRGGRGGRGGARGRGRGNAAAGPSRGGGRAAATPAGLPQRPNWQLDDDVGGTQTPAQLSYEDDDSRIASSAASASVEAKPLARAPQSAGLPANPLANVPNAVYGEAVPPGAHINPLFAHRWQPVQDQTPQPQAYPALPQQSAPPQQPYYPQQAYYQPQQHGYSQAYQNATSYWPPHQSQQTYDPSQPYAAQQPQQWPQYPYYPQQQHPPPS